MLRITLEALVELQMRVWSRRLVGNLEDVLGRSLAEPTSLILLEHLCAFRRLTDVLAMTRYAEGLENASYPEELAPLVQHLLHAGIELLCWRFPLARVSSNGVVLPYHQGKVRNPKG